MAVTPRHAAVRRWDPPATAVAVGVARRDITPPVGIRARNWGAARSDVSTGVHAPLTATVLALGDEHQPAYLVSLDLGWWASAEDERALRDVVLGRLGAGEERLLIHLIHTHAGPSVRTDEVDLPGGELIADYIAALADHIVGACEEAARARVPALVTWAYGRCDLAVNRDLPCGDGTVVAFNPGAPADDAVLVGRITDADGRVLGTLLNYACHPTTLAWDNTLLSPDLVDGARAIVEAETGSPCLFVQGASGDLGPRYGFTGDPADADRNGHALGHAAVAALTLMPPPGTGMELTRIVESGASVGVWEHRPTDGLEGLHCERIEVPLPLADRQVAHDPDLPEHVAQERARRAARLRRGYVSGDRARHPVWIWHLGPAVLVAHPGEAYSALQTELRRRHGDRPVVVANLTNGPGHVYLPTREAYERDRYQVWQSVLAAGCLERLIDAADERIEAAPAPTEET